jgi:hypothetical protein
MRWSMAEEASDYVAGVASSMGLICFDSQARQLRLCSEIALVSAVPVSSARHPGLASDSVGAGRRAARGPSFGDELVLQLVDMAGLDHDGGFNG